MTLILAIKDPQKERVIMCADSVAWRGDEYARLVTPKLWRSNGWVCGLSGMSSQLEIAKRITLPTLSPGVDFAAAHDAVHVEILPAIEEAIAKRIELVRRADADYKENGHAMLLAYGPWIWYAHAGEGVATTRGFEACGSGADYALGAMQVLNDLPLPMDTAFRACFAVGAIVRSVLEPWHWMATDGAGGVW